jgi:thiol:disulfide interchange protein DsbA
MMRVLFLVAGLATLAMSGLAISQDAGTRFQKDVHYTELTPRQPRTVNDDTIEVAEIFAYSCIHCRNFEPALEHWLTTKADYITFTRIPAAWGDPVSDMHAKAFYTAQALGKLDEMHEVFFKEFHDRRNYMESEAKMQEIFARFDVDEAEFKSTFNSFLVANKINQAKDLMMRYRVAETPIIVVNGKYQSRGAQAGDYGTWFAIIDELAAREHAAQSE